MSCQEQRSRNFLVAALTLLLQAEEEHSRHEQTQWGAKLGLMNESHVNIWGLMDLSVQTIP